MRATRRLTDKTIKAFLAVAKPGGKPLSDGENLALHILPAGTPVWQQRYRRPLSKVENVLSYGPYPVVSLREAREKCQEAKALLRQGIDPGEKKQAEKTAPESTLEALSREWLPKFVREQDYRHTCLRRLEMYVFPSLGSRDIGQIQPLEALRCLQRIAEAGGHETAKRTRQLCDRIYRYAIISGRALTNPFGDLKDALAPVPEKHFAAFTDPAEFAGLLRAIRSYNGSAVVRFALLLAPLVFVRPGELRAAEWSEINFENAEWRIRAERMKMRQQHIVPLSTQALGILRDIKRVTGESQYVFPSPRSSKRPLSDVALLAALRRMGFEQGSVTVHGFRSSASTMLNEQGFNRDAIERQLAHGERDGVRAAYNYAEYLPERRRMMQHWADYLDQLCSGNLKQLTTKPPIPTMG